MAWIDRRKVKANRLGMLRSAIEQDWPEPGGRLGEPNTRIQRSAGAGFTAALEEAKHRILGPSGNTFNHPSS